MPELQDIELFKRKINSLGNEEQILAERGEKIADVPAPEQGVPDDISALLNGIAAGPDLAEEISSESLSDTMPESGTEDSGVDEAAEDFFDTELEDIPELDFSEDVTSDDDFGSIADLGAMFEDSEPEDDSALMPDDLVDQGRAEYAVTAGDGSEPAEYGDEFSAGVPEDFDIPDYTDTDFNEIPGIDEPSSEVPEDFSDIDTFDLPEDFDDFSIPEADAEITGESPETSGSEAQGFEISDDLSALEDMTGEIPEIETPEVTEAAEEEGLDFDAGELDTFDLPDEIDELEGLEETVPVSDSEDLSAFEDYDITEEAAAEDLFSDSDMFEEGAAGEAEPSEEDFEVPDLDSYDLPEDLDKEPGTEQLPEEEGPEEIRLESPSDSEDDFDLGSLEDISLEDELEIHSEEEGELEDLGMLESLEDGDEFPEASPGEPDEFSLEDLGEEYSSFDDIEEEAPPVPAGAAAVPELSLPDKAEESDFSIKREKLERVTETLNQLPRNLKFIIEDLIGNKGLSGRRLDNLVEKLAAGASVKEIAALAEKITGRKIRIPSQYERKTWEELEEEKQTFSYIFRHQILPYTGKIALVSIILFFTVFVIKKQVYDPLYSSYLYNKGYEQLENENYKASDRLFNKASRLRPFKKQFYRYADAYIEMREYDRAEQKYITMLGRSLSSEREKSRRKQQKGYYPTDKKGFLDYAALKTFYQGEYDKSDRILEDFILLKGNKWDYDALLDKIDNFLNWGEIEKKQFDSAGYVLNDSLSKFGNKPELVFRKMAYYLHSGRIDNLEKKALSDIAEGNSKSIDVRKYYSMLNEFRAYVENIKDKYADPYMISDFYRYMIDHNDIDGIEENLIKVSNQDKKIIEPHYQLSRYWNRMEKKDLERRALSTIENLLKNFDNSHMMNNYPHSFNYAAGQRRKMDVLSNNRLGKFSYNDDEILDAQRYYKKAVDRYEKYSPLPGETSSYGHIYEDLGDIYYYNAGKYNDALKYFGKAYSTGYKNNNLDYKIGFINYKNRNYSKAAENFYDISLNARENEAALFAFANASFNYGVYSPAKAYYDRVIEKMEYWREHEKVFDLDRRKDQMEILEKLMQVYNNQGVTLFKLAEKNRNQEYYSKSLVYLSQSAELYDTLMRDPLTMNKTLSKPLAQLNMKWILLNSGWKNMNYEKSVIPYSSDNMTLDSPVIYNSIDHDLYSRVNINLK